MIPILTMGETHSELMNTNIFFIARLRSTLLTPGAIVITVCISCEVGVDVSGAAAAAAAAMEVVEVVAEDDLEGREDLEGRDVVVGRDVAEELCGWIMRRALLLSLLMLISKPVEDTCTDMISPNSEKRLIVSRMRREDILISAS